MKVTQLDASQALCAQTDPELFFAQNEEYRKGKPQYESLVDAKNICAKCPLTLQCLLAGVHGKEEYGIWGGSMPRERRQIKTMADAEAFVAKLRSKYLSFERKRRR